MDEGFDEEAHVVEALAQWRELDREDVEAVVEVFPQMPFVERFFGEKLGMRFRGSYFPFTEPSLELDIECTVCHGSGCAVCKRTGWVEILGCGMVHPNVLEGVGYDPDEVSGYAFGMGPDRIAMLRHRIPDIRLLYENDMRFLHQFGRDS